MIDYSTNPQELLLMIGDREFMHYKAKRRVEELEKEVSRLKDGLKQACDRILELESGGLEQTNNYVELLHRSFTGVNGQGLRCSQPLKECPNESSRRDDQISPIPREVSGEGIGNLYRSSS